MSIAGVTIAPLGKFEDYRGVLLHMMRADAAAFERFGEIYFSGVREGAVKAWRKHRSLTSNLAVPVGSIRLVLFDARPDSPTQGKTMTIEMGEKHYQRVTIPPGIWTGWKGLGPGMSLVANLATEPHDPDEVESLSADSPIVPHRWQSG